MGRSMMTFLEFFAGAGMVRVGLGPDFRCLLANDIDPKKAQSYAANFGRRNLVVGDVGALTPADLPGVADLAWASPTLPGPLARRRPAQASTERAQGRSGASGASCRGFAPNSASRA